ncbi:MAG TPA: TonB-dependent receptor [Flavobacterium sp.]|jgi:iron complex outermembrane receptor protein
MNRSFLFLLFLLITSVTFSQEALVSDINISERTNTEQDTVRNKKGEVLQEVIITSDQQKTPVTVGKAGIAPMDLPQSSAVINQATLENQQVQSMTDVLKNTNGVYIMGTTGGYQEEIASRGSSLASSNTFKNGVRYFNGMATELSGIEKVEFLKGSAAILFGNVSAGGVLNLVTKKPKFGFGGEAGLRIGSFNTIKPTLDLYGSVNKKQTMAFRINGSYEKADSFRDYVESERYYVNPSFLIQFTPKTQLLIEGDYLNDHRTPDFGAGVVQYEIVELPRSRFLGVTFGYFDSQQVSTTATLTHELSDKWNLSFINAFRYYETELFSNTRPNAGGLITAEGEWNRSLQRSQVHDNYFLQQIDLKGKFNTGKVGHQFLAGIDWEKYQTNTTAFYNAPYGSINIFEPYNPAVEEPEYGELNENTLTRTSVARTGIYVQDLISFSKYIKLLAGIRYTYQDTETDVFKYEPVPDPDPSNPVAQTAPTNNYDDAFSPRVGLIIQPSANHSIFTTYSNSFVTNTGTDINGNALEPSVIDQYEIGVKNKFFKDRLHANVTVYQITNSNLAQTSLANGNTNSAIRELAGKTRSQGVELDIVANPIEGLSVLAGYSFNETKYLESNTYIVGSQLRYNPKHTANLNANYRIYTGKLKGLMFGLINTYFGDRYAGRSTTEANPGYKLVPLEGYFQVDATMGYTFKKWTVRTKLSNIFNELNYNIHDDNSLNPIAPRNYSVSLNYNF